MKYRIDGENQVFRTLKERIKYLMGGCIYGIRNDEYVTETPIIVGQSSYRFGKTTKI